MLSALAEDVNVSTSSGERKFSMDGRELSTSDRKPFQVVQETALGPKFLTSWDTAEAAMRDCRALNICTGDAFKTILWKPGTPCLRCNDASREFKADNLLPSFIESKGAVVGYPEARPIAAVYNHGAQVVFSPFGQAVSSGLAAFDVSFFGLPPERSSARLTFLEAMTRAKQAAARYKKPTFVVARANVRPSMLNGRLIPFFSVQPNYSATSRSLREHVPNYFTRRMGLGGFGEMNPTVRPVTAEEFQQLVDMSQQYANTY